MGLMLRAELSQNQMSCRVGYGTDRAFEFAMLLRDTILRREFGLPGRRSLRS